MSVREPLVRMLEREVTALTTERDQLRADCENETKWAAHYLAQSIADKDRAERAEASLKQWNDAADASRQPNAFYDGYSEAQMRAMQAMLTKAEAELAMQLRAGGAK